ncbi:hypothetical protein [Nonlabens agnitus]|uniref:Uncharacterized protein n=1 Tax=Nonlabens agnitus TaxID=870484 RepID=A0A2S9WXD3_9FLAO|nr:hypothetical protein [Nonlabens agnitus]PRP68129.1 hypothetical protein BST86_14040 [Nonlabens agnitus]
MCKIEIKPIKRLNIKQQRLCLLKMYEDEIVDNLKFRSERSEGRISGIKTGLFMMGFTHKDLKNLREQIEKTNEQ